MKKKSIFSEMTKLAIATAMFFSMTACNQSSSTSKSNILSNPAESSQSNFYASGGEERKVKFSALIKTKEFGIKDVPNLSEQRKRSFELYTVGALVQYLYGPLTHQEIAGIKTDFKISVDWESARASIKKSVELKFTYEGQWVIANHVLEDPSLMAIPLPFNTDWLLTTDWKNCTDSEPDHQTEEVFWYYWDPSRNGCDHVDGKEYQILEVEVGEATIATTETYPDYSKLLKSAGIDNNLQMTFAFGYVTDVENANPNKDGDYGMQEYRKFIRYMDKQAKKLGFEKIPVTQAEYLYSAFPEKIIGYRYKGTKDGATVDVKVVTSANIDQMDLFAKSYAHDHDGFFAWFGHSRVGSGFDAQTFASKVNNDNEYYSITPNYQLVYWAGCNSYSYYTLPFFAQKAALQPALDPNGTLGLDILSNALPSLFSFNAYNAMVMFEALVNWETPTSYQDIIINLENYGMNEGGVIVLVNIMGDEDNK